MTLATWNVQSLYRPGALAKLNDELNKYGIAITAVQEIKWSGSEKIEKILMTWERKILRKIYGPTMEKGQWRIKTNLELMTKYKSQDIVTTIKTRRLEWIGHVIRMNETRSLLWCFTELHGFVEQRAWFP